MLTKLRLLLAIELIAFYFAAPYIILMGLDETRGILPPDTSYTSRLWTYALLIGLYPLLQSIVSPYVGRKLDLKCCKISTLRHIHLANSLCYLLLSLAAFFKMLSLALIGLCIPGLVGCASPVGKSLIATLTDPEARVKEFAKLAFIKGLVKLIAPLVSAALFYWVFHESGYSSIFVVSSTLSCICFLFTYTLTSSQSHKLEPSELSPACAPLALFSSIVSKNCPLLLVFAALVMGYAVFVKFSPLVFFDALSHHPYLVNYFSSLVGLAYSVNQLIVIRNSLHIERASYAIFSLLALSSLFLSITPIGPLWGLWIFLMLFCFPILTTCMEARLSLQGIKGFQGATQGILYSLENVSLLLSPIIGSLLGAVNPFLPLYFVSGCAFMAGILFAVNSASKKRVNVS